MTYKIQSPTKKPVLKAARVGVGSSFSNIQSRAMNKLKIN
jgi:hypothetical protein